MRSITIILAAFCLCFSACGPSKEDMIKTCECEALNEKIKGSEGDYMLGEQLSSADAEKKAITENQEAYDKCIQLHKKMGEDNYTKAAQTCSLK